MHTWSFTVPDSDDCAKDEPSAAYATALMVNSPLIGTSVADTLTDHGSATAVPANNEHDSRLALSS